MAPKYTVDLLHCYTLSRQLRSISKNLLVMGKSNLKFYGERSSQVGDWKNVDAKYYFSHRNIFLEKKFL